MPANLSKDQLDAMMDSEIEEWLDELPTKVKREWIQEFIDLINEKERLERELENWKEHFSSIMRQLSEKGTHGKD